MVSASRLSHDCAEYNDSARQWLLLQRERFGNIFRSFASKAFKLAELSYLRNTPGWLLK